MNLVRRVAGARGSVEPMLSGARGFAKAAKKPTTYDKGQELEERVAKMLRRRGHLNVKKNVRVKDKNGNWSEFDVVYGWPIRHYVECKNYSSSVKLEMVAKFKVCVAVSNDAWWRNWGEVSAIVATADDDHM